MANVLVVPASGSIIFDSQTAGSSTVSPLSTAPRLSYDNAGGINIQSYVTATSALDRFTVDGTNGRLFSVSDALTGSIFSVNDISGLPIIEVNSGVTDVITMGTYGTNALVVSGGNVAIGTATPGSAKLTVESGTITTSQPISLNQTWNNSGVTFSALQMNVTDTASNAASLLMDLRVGGGTPVSKFSVKKNGVLTLNNSGTITWTSADDLTFSSGLAYQRVRAYSFWASSLFAGIGDNGTPASAAVHLANSQFVGWTSGSVINLGTYDTFIGRDNAANTLAQRNGATPQEFRIYSTYTDASNYERFFIKTNVGATSATQIGLSAGGSGQNRNLEFVAGGSTKMTIVSGGRVGIGTTSPSTNLEITTTNNGDGIKLQRSDGERSAWLVDEGTGNGALYLFNGSNSNTGYIVGNGNSFLNGGNLGIGTSSPNEKLTVSGNISASGTIYSAGSAVVVSPTIVSIQAVTSSQYSALVSAGQALSSVLYLVQDP